MSQMMAVAIEAGFAASPLIDRYIERLQSFRCGRP